MSRTPARTLAELVALDTNEIIESLLKAGAPPSEAPSATICTRCR